MSANIGLSGLTTREVCSDQFISVPMCSDVLSWGSMTSQTESIAQRVWCTTNRQLFWKDTNLFEFRSKLLTFEIVWQEYRSRKIVSIYLLQTIAKKRIQTLDSMSLLLKYQSIIREPWIGSDSNQKQFKCEFHFSLTNGWKCNEI